MKITILLLALLAAIAPSASTSAQNMNIGIFDASADVGHPKNPGSASFDKLSKTYHLTGAGYNIWFNRDEFHYLYKKIKGDFIITGNFAFEGDKGNNHRKIGWMLRASTDDDAVHISAVEHGDGLTVMQWRVNKGDSMRDPQGEIFYKDKNFEVLQVERKGKVVTMRVGHPAGELQTVGTHEMSTLPDEILLGMFICSHDAEATESATVKAVSLKKK